MSTVPDRTSAEGSRVEGLDSARADGGAASPHEAASSAAPTSQIAIRDPCIEVSFLSHRKEKPEGARSVQSGTRISGADSHVPTKKGSWPARPTRSTERVPLRSWNRARYRPWMLSVVASRIVNEFARNSYAP